MNLKDSIRTVPDFPAPGVRFRDITPLLKDPAAYAEVIGRMVAAVGGQKIDAVVCPEARGFVFGAPLAHALGAGFIPVRRPGKLPLETLRIDYDLEGVSSALEVHKDAIAPGERVVVVDDLLATGATALATCRLMQQMGAQIVRVIFALELTYMDGREGLRDYPVEAIIKY